MAAEHPLNVMSYNVLGARHASSLRQVVRQSDPDVVLVNECPKTPLLWRRRCRRLATDWGMRFVTGGRPAGSNMIVVCPGVDVVASGSQVLPQPWFQPRRGIAWARLTIRGQSFGVVACHLSLKRARRLPEVEEVIAAANALGDDPVIVAGDLNEPPSGPSWRRLREAGFVDHGSGGWLTFPASKPEVRIDALLVRGAVEVLSHGDPDVPSRLMAQASDHRPVAARLKLSVKAV